MAKTYMTKQGDMWDAIALREMDSEMHMSRLIEANPAHRETVIFSAGTSLVVPDVPETATTNLPPWKS